MTPLPTSSFADSPAGPEEDLGDYRAVSAMAVIGVVLGILSATAFIHPLLWLLACIAVIVNAVALRQLAESNSRLLGRKAALAGMAVSLIFTIAAPTQFLIHRHMLSREAVGVAREWFGYFRDNRPEMAFSMSHYPMSKEARERLPMPARGESGSAMRPIRDFLREPQVDLMLKLGKRAHIRFFETEEVWSGGNMEGVREIYVVTVGENAQPTSFFIRLGVTRSRDLATGEWQWQVTKNEFLNAPPPGLEGADSG